MDGLRLSRPAVVRIERDHGSRAARILVDGRDVSSHVTAVSWSMQAGKMPTATITFMDAEIMADAEDVESWTESSGPAESAAATTSEGEDENMTEPEAPATDDEYETHEWAVEWPIFGGRTERDTFATEAEARERCPVYGPSAYVTKIEPVQVPVE